MIHIDFDKNIHNKILLHAHGSRAMKMITNVSEMKFTHVELLNAHSHKKVSVQLQEACVLIILVSNYDSSNGTFESIVKEAKRLDVLNIILFLHPVVSRDRYLEKFVQAAEHYSGICDSLFIIPDFSNTPIVQDNLHKIAVRTFVELFAKVGEIKLDFKDYEFIFKNKGIGLFGLGTGIYTELALEKAMGSIDSSNKKFTLHDTGFILLNIKAGHDFSLDEFQVSTSKIPPLLNEDAWVYYRLVVDNSMVNKIEVALFATGLSNSME